METLDIETVKRANERAGQHFFSPDAMKSFQTRTGQVAYKGPGGVFFVTSENYGSGRAYTVRQYWGDSHRITSASSFGAFATSKTADRHAQNYARDGKPLSFTDTSDQIAVTLEGPKLVVFQGVCVHCGRFVYGYKDEAYPDPRGQIPPAHCRVWFDAQEHGFKGGEVVACWDCANEHGREGYEGLVEAAKQKAGWVVAP